jgi:hypothetical protein
MAILVIFVFFVLPPILGLIVLTCVPSFRLTFINFLIFVVGALLGMFVLGNLIMLVLGNSGNHRSIRGENDLADFAILVGMLVGGTGLVWLKMRFAKARGRNEKPGK